MCMYMYILMGRWPCGSTSPHQKHTSNVSCKYWGWGGRYCPSHPVRQAVGPVKRATAGTQDGSKCNCQVGIGFHNLLPCFIWGNSKGCQKCLPYRVTAQNIPKMYHIDPPAVWTQVVPQSLCLTEVREAIPNIRVIKQWAYAVFLLNC